MGLGQIVVETSQLDAVAQKVDGLADKYLSEYTALYTYVTEMQSAWAGTDNTAYTSYDGALLNEDKTQILIYPKSRVGEYKPCGFIKGKKSFFIL